MDVNFTARFMVDSGWKNLQSPLDHRARSMSAPLLSVTLLRCLHGAIWQPQQHHEHSPGSISHFGYNMVHPYIEGTTSHVWDGIA